MGQLGFAEMLVIFIVALLVFGPKKLPELGKSLGKGIREFKKATEELKSSWEDQVKDVTAPAPKPTTALAPDQTREKAQQRLRRAGARDKQTPAVDARQ